MLLKVAMKPTSTPSDPAVRVPNKDVVLIERPRPVVVFKVVNSVQRPPLALNIGTGVLTRPGALEPFHCFVDLVRRAGSGARLLSGLLKCSEEEELT